MKKLLAAIFATFLMCTALGACVYKTQTPYSSSSSFAESSQSGESLSSEEVSSVEQSSEAQSSEEISSKEESSEEMDTGIVEESSVTESSSKEESSNDDPPAVSGSVRLTLSSMGLEDAEYSTTMDMTSVNGFGIGYLQLGDYGNGIQMRSKNGVSSAIWNVTEFPAPITKIVLTHNSEKTTYNGNTYKLDLGTTADLEASEITVSTSYSGNVWTIDVSGEYTYFQLTHANTYTQYWDSIVVYYGENSGNNGSGNAGNQNPSSRLYNNWTEEEAALIQHYLGGSLPFLANDEYYLETLDVETFGADGVNFYTFGNTQAEFASYLTVFDAEFSFDGTDVDEYGDTWYLYSNDLFYVGLAYYEYDEGMYVVDVYAYIYEEDNEEESSEIQSSSKEESSETESSSKEDTATVREVDFTKATNVKDVTDQGYYLDGCPTTGSPSVLVVPVQFSDVTAASKGYDVEKIKTAFNGTTGTTDYYSVKEYYKLSSYNKLDVNFTVLDDWFTPANNSAYYAGQTMNYYGDRVEIGDQMIMHELLAYLDGQGWDLSQFDSDNNGVIDAIVFITTLDVDPDSIFQWAYRYWDIYSKTEYDGVVANDYMWASYQFMHEDSYGYDNVNGINTYTYIHEFGHVLGADDYYDTSDKTDGPLESYDIMDSGLGDHNAFSKFNYGWVTTSRLIEGATTVTLEAFSKAGDSLIIANNWNDQLGAYQDYFIIVYYTNDGLNMGEGGYFEEEGILVYHVNSTIEKYEEDGETYYDLMYNNTDPSDSYGTENNLIEYVKNGYAFVYEVDDSLSSTVKDDSNKKVPFTFYVSSLDGDTATLVFSKNN